MRSSISPGGREVFAVVSFHAEEKTGFGAGVVALGELFEQVDGGGADEGCVIGEIEEMDLPGVVLRVVLENGLGDLEAVEIVCAVAEVELVLPDGTDVHDGFDEAVAPRPVALIEVGLDGGDGGGIFFLEREGLGQRKDVLENRFLGCFQAGLIVEDGNSRVTLNGCVVTNTAGEEGGIKSQIGPVIHALGELIAGGSRCPFGGA